MNKMWWLYLIQTCQKTIYTGISTNPARRWQQHQGKKSGGAKYLKAHRPHKIILLLPVGERRLAAQLEAQLKKLSHSQKKVLAAQMAAQSKKYFKQWQLNF